MRNALAVTVLLVGVMSMPASFAEESDTRVARVSYVSGDMSYQRGDDEGWNGLRVNTPLVTGDRLYADSDGRAEVELGNGIVVRVDGGTDVEIVNSTRDVAQLGLDGGVMTLSVNSLPSGFTLEVDTPTGAATIMEPGRYRFDVTDRLTTYSAVRGSISMAVEGQQLDVLEGESLQFEGTDPPTYGYVGLPARTPFDTWADVRDSRWERSASARYVHHDVVGYEDLDEHGTWRDNPEYGRVWVPSGIGVEWAPYREGRWIWQDPYGWTWVSYEPWGWAPYHYGRWVFLTDSWCWVPPPPQGFRGPAVALSIEPVYAPALVAFVGGGSWGASLSIGGPAIGWVPLAPRERYYYPWQPAPQVVVSHYTNITVINAVTVVNSNTFTTGTVRPIKVERAQIERAPVIGLTAVGVVPARASLAVTNEKRPEPSALPRPRTERPLVARLVPPPKPQPFVQKVAEIQRTGQPVPHPVAVTGPVGKPFTPGVAAPAGIKPFSAPAPAGRRELNVRPGAAETRAPKKIEGDITPPPAAARRGPPGREPAITPRPGVATGAASPAPQVTPAPAPTLQETVPPRGQMNRPMPPGHGPPTSPAPQAGQPRPPLEATPPPTSNPPHGPTNRPMPPGHRPPPPEGERMPPPQTDEPRPSPHPEPGNRPVQPGQHPLPPEARKPPAPAPGQPSPTPDMSKQPKKPTGKPGHPAPSPSPSPAP